MHWNIMAKLGSLGRRKPNESMKISATLFIGVVFGFLIGILIPSARLIRMNVYSIASCTKDDIQGNNISKILQKPIESSSSNQNNIDSSNSNGTQIYVPTNPRGAESLPPGIVVPESDFYLHRLWGEPEEDLPIQLKYLITFTVGYNQRKNINAAVKKFSENYTILLFHYDGRTNEWDEYEWSKRAIHVSVKKQTKWWYAKRFLHPDIVAAYDYIFIWDEDLGVDHFDAEKYIQLVKKHSLEISQPAVVSMKKHVTWAATRKRDDSDVHKEDISHRCHGHHLAPCPPFVEIMAPVFSREAWRCVWHMIQNDLVHGWGLDFEFRRCAEPAHEKMGVVDSQWILHKMVPSLGDQGQASKGKTAWQGVRERCRKEWEMFHTRMENALKAYYKKSGGLLSHEDHKKISSIKETRNL